MFHCLFLRYALRMMNAQSGANLFELLLLLFIYFLGEGLYCENQSGNSIAIL